MRRSSVPRPATPEQREGIVEPLGHRHSSSPVVARIPAMEWTRPRPGLSPTRQSGRRLILLGGAGPGVGLVALVAAEA